MHTLATQPIRVLLIDDHALIRSGLRLLIDRQPKLKVIGEAASRTDALAIAKREQPDIILLDLNLPGASGLDLIPELLGAARDSHILILTGVGDPEAHARAMHLGAMGVVLKEKAPEVLIKAIEKVHQGEIWLDRLMIASVFGAKSRSSDAKKHDPEAVKIATLTEREREVISLISEGLKNKQIAERLFISETTVSHHLTSIFSKLEVADRLGLIVYAYRHRLAKP